MPLGRMLPLVVVLALACSRSAAGQPDQAGATWQVEGPIRAIDPPAWVVDKSLVTVPEDARVTGRPAPGAIARLSGTRAASGQLVAREVQIVQDAPPPAEPTATAASQPTAPPTPPRRATPAVKQEPPAHGEHGDDEEDEEGGD